ncbi:MAG: amino acid transporter permease [Actinomycetia bacterium]|jgi:polar amino acid transport system permease protein|nr:amino acid transporter permease [Actinomycetes bacterium]
MALKDEVRPGRPENIRAVPVRHYGRWIATAVLVYLGVWLALGVAKNPNFEWNVVGQYFTSSTVLDGLDLTLRITFAAMFIGIVGGVILAVMRLSPNPLVSGSAWLYIWFFRGTPVLVQILAWNFISVLAPKVGPTKIPEFGIGIPFGPTFVHFNANNIITPLVAGILALGLNEAAYMSEIVRAGILSVETGQSEAAQALGMTRLLVLGRIVLPQAMRIIIPPTGNETISMLKTSSLVSVIAVSDLLYSVQIIYGRTFQQIPLLMVAVLWYLMMTSVLSVGQFYLERYFGRGIAQRQTMLEKLWANLRTVRPASGGIR